MPEKKSPSSCERARPAVDKLTKTAAIQRLSAAKCTMKHIPYILSKRQKIAVWSDVREILFPSCSNPKCSIVLNALKHCFGYPGSDSVMHACSSRESLQFLRIFVSVAPGTPLIDLDYLQNNKTWFMELSDVVTLKHRGSKDANTVICNALRTMALAASNTKTDHLWISVNNIWGSLDVKPSNTCKIKRHLPAVLLGWDKAKQVSQKSTAVVEKCSSGMPSQAKGKPGSQDTASVKTADEEKLMVPCIILQELFPLAKKFLYNMAQQYLSGTCTRSRSSDILCCSVEDGKHFSKFLFNSKGEDSAWQSVTSNSLLLAWSQFRDVLAPVLLQDSSLTDVQLHVVSPQKQVDEKNVCTIRYVAAERNSPTECESASENDDVEVDTKKADAKSDDKTKKKDTDRFPSTNAVKASKEPSSSSMPKKSQSATSVSTSANADKKAKSSRTAHVGNVSPAQYRQIEEKKKKLKDKGHKLKKTASAAAGEKLGKDKAKEHLNKKQTKVVSLPLSHGKPAVLTYQKGTVKTSDKRQQATDPKSHCKMMPAKQDIKVPPFQCGDSATTMDNLNTSSGKSSAKENTISSLQSYSLRRDSNNSAVEKQSCDEDTTNSKSNCQKIKVSAQKCLESGDAALICKPDRERSKGHQSVNQMRPTSLQDGKTAANNESATMLTGKPYTENDAGRKGYFLSAVSTFFSQPQSVLKNLDDKKISYENSGVVCPTIYEKGVTKEGEEADDIRDEDYSVTEEYESSTDSADSSSDQTSTSDRVLGKKPSPNILHDKAGPQDIEKYVETVMSYKRSMSTLKPFSGPFTDVQVYSVMDRSAVSSSGAESSHSVSSTTTSVSSITSSVSSTASVVNSTASSMSYITSSVSSTTKATPQSDQGQVPNAPSCNGPNTSQAPADGTAAGGNRQSMSVLQLQDSKIWREQNKQEPMSTERNKGNSRTSMVDKKCSRPMSSPCVLNLNDQVSWHDNILSNKVGCGVYNPATWKGNGYQNVNNTTQNSETFVSQDSSSGLGGSSNPATQNSSGSPSLRPCWNTPSSGSETNTTEGQQSRVATDTVTVAASDALQYAVTGQKLALHTGKSNSTLSKTGSFCSAPALYVLDPSKRGASPGEEQSTPVQQSSSQHPIPTESRSKDSTTKQRPVSVSSVQSRSGSQLNGALSKIGGMSIGEKVRFLSARMDQAITSVRKTTIPEAYVPFKYNHRALNHTSTASSTTGKPRWNRDTVLPAPPNRFSAVFSPVKGQQRSKSAEPKTKSKASKTPNYGPSSSTSPDIYDMFARRKKPKQIKPDNATASRMLHVQPSQSRQQTSVPMATVQTYVVHRYQHRYESTSHTSPYSSLPGNLAESSASNSRTNGSRTVSPDVSCASNEEEINDGMREENSASLNCICCRLQRDCQEHYRKMSGGDVRNISGNDDCKQTDETPVSDNTDADAESGKIAHDAEEAATGGMANLPRKCDTTTGPSARATAEEGPDARTSNSLESLRNLNNVVNIDPMRDPIKGSQEGAFACWSKKMLGLTQPARPGYGAGERNMSLKTYSQDRNCSSGPSGSHTDLGGTEKDQDNPPSRQRQSTIFHDVLYKTSSGVTIPNISSVTPITLRRPPAVPTTPPLYFRERGNTDFSLMNRFSVIPDNSEFIFKCQPGRLQQPTNAKEAYSGTSNENSEKCTNLFMKKIKAAKKKKILADSLRAECVEELETSADQSRVCSSSSSSASQYSSTSTGSEAFGSSNCNEDPLFVSTASSSVEDSNCSLCTDQPNTDSPSTKSQGVKRSGSSLKPPVRNVEESRSPFAMTSNEKREREQNSCGEESTNSPHSPNQQVGPLQSSGARKMSKTPKAGRKQKKKSKSRKKYDLMEVASYEIIPSRSSEIFRKEAIEQNISENSRSPTRTSSHNSCSEAGVEKRTESTDRPPLLVALKRVDMKAKPKAKKSPSIVIPDCRSDCDSTTRANSETVLSVMAAVNRGQSGKRDSAGEGSSKPSPKQKTPKSRKKTTKRSERTVQGTKQPKRTKPLHSPETQNDQEIEYEMDNTETIMRSERSISLRKSGRKEKKEKDRNFGSQKEACQPSSKAGRNQNKNADVSSKPSTEKSSSRTNIKPTVSFHSVSSGVKNHDESCNHQLHEGLPDQDTLVPANTGRSDPIQEAFSSSGNMDGCQERHCQKTDDCTRQKSDKQKTLPAEVYSRNNASSENSSHKDTGEVRAGRDEGSGDRIQTPATNTGENSTFAQSLQEQLLLLDKLHYKRKWLRCYYDDESDNQVDGKSYEDKKTNELDGFSDNLCKDSYQQGLLFSQVDDQLSAQQFVQDAENLKDLQQDAEPQMPVLSPVYGENEIRLRQQRKNSDKDPAVQSDHSNSASQPFDESNTCSQTAADLEPDQKDNVYFFDNGVDRPIIVVDGDRNVPPLYVKSLMEPGVMYLSCVHRQGNWVYVPSDHSQLTEALVFLKRDAPFCVEMFAQIVAAVNVDESGQTDPVSKSSGAEPVQQLYVPGQDQGMALSSQGSQDFYQTEGEAETMECESGGAKMGVSDDSQQAHSQYGTAGDGTWRQVVDEVTECQGEQNAPVFPDTENATVTVIQGEGMNFLENFNENLAKDGNGQVQILYIDENICTDNEDETTQTFYVLEHQETNSFDKNNRENTVTGSVSSEHGKEPSTSDEQSQSSGDWVNAVSGEPAEGDTVNCRQEPSVSCIEESVSSFEGQEEVFPACIQTGVDDILVPDADDESDRVAVEDEVRLNQDYESDWTHLNSKPPEDRMPEAGTSVSDRVATGLEEKDKEAETLTACFDVGGNLTVGEEAVAGYYGDLTMGDLLTANATLAEDSNKEKLDSATEHVQERTEASNDETQSKPAKQRDPNMFLKYWDALYSAQEANDLHNDVGNQVSSTSTFDIRQSQILQPETEKHTPKEPNFPYQEFANDEVSAEERDRILSVVYKSKLRAQRKVHYLPDVEGPEEEDEESENLDSLEENSTSSSGTSDFIPGGSNRTPARPRRRCARKGRRSKVSGNSRKKPDFPDFSYVQEDVKNLARMVNVINGSVDNSQQNGTEETSNTCTEKEKKQQPPKAKPSTGKKKRQSRSTPSDGRRWNADNEDVPDDEDKRKLAAEGIIRNQQRYLDIIQHGNDVASTRKSGSQATVAMDNVSLESIKPDSDTTDFVHLLSKSSVNSMAKVDITTPDIEHSETTGQGSGDHVAMETKGEGDNISRQQKHNREGTSTNTLQPPVTDDTPYYQIVEDEDGNVLGGFAYCHGLSFPFVYINGYKFTTMKDALACFKHCAPACTIPRSVVSKHKGNIKSLSTWDQVYKLELIKLKKGPSVKTGDTLIRLDCFLSLLSQLKQTVAERHKNTHLKRSQQCRLEDMLEEFNRNPQWRQPP